MRIAYVNAHYQANHSGGGHVHMEQFIANAIALGHEVWAYPGNKYPGVQIIPTNRIGHIRTMRQMDALYIRLENSSPEICSWSLPPRRSLYGFPVVVWEFNTLPDELYIPDEPQDIRRKVIPSLIKYSPGCDLAVCVSPALADAVGKKLHMKQVLTVPNGSDPELFRPDVEIVPRLSPFREKFNVVWIGSIKESWHDLGMLAKSAFQVLESENGGDICFHILGGGLSGMMADMPSNVYYWGAEYYPRLPHWLAGMDVGVSLYHPSRAALGSPLKIFDYMASGLAVISTDHPVAKEIYDQLNVSNYMIPPGDADALTNLLITLETDKERVKSLAWLVAGW